MQAIWRRGHMPMLPLTHAVAYPRYGLPTQASHGHVPQAGPSWAKGPPNGSCARADPQPTSQPPSTANMGLLHGISKQMRKHGPAEFGEECVLLAHTGWHTAPDAGSQ